ncbi:MAG TPA: hypothetical protein VIP11_01855 [Gemmatimonadaceae bacterium]
MTEQFDATLSPASLIERALTDEDIADAVQMCRRALLTARRLYARMGPRHAAYVIRGAVTRGRAALFIVTASGEARALTRELLLDMASDDLATSAWYGPIPIILGIPRAEDVTSNQPLASIDFSAAPFVGGEGSRSRIILRGAVRASDERMLVITRPLPWRCLPRAYPPLKRRDQ